MSDDLISRQEAIEALWKALYEYEDKTEKQFQESEDLDVGDWIEHRVFVQNMNDIDRQTILNLPPAQAERKKGKWIAPATEQIYRCSVCEEYTTLEVPRLFYHYCPNCGAEMEGSNGET